MTVNSRFCVCNCKKHRTESQNGLEGSLKIIQFQTPAMGRDTFICRSASHLPFVLLAHSDFTVSARGGEHKVCDRQLGEQEARWEMIQRWPCISCFRPVKTMSLSSPRAARSRSVLPVVIFNRLQLELMPPHSLLGVGEFNVDQICSLHGT